MIEGLSMRLNAVASQVISGESMADIATDHGQLPVALVQHGLVPYAIAMDVADGPLAGARRTAADLYDKVSIRKSNGFEALRPGEVSSVSIAGLGGGSMVQILLNGREVWSKISRLILQPQGLESEVRLVLIAAGWRCVHDLLVEDRGKIYMVMSWEPGVDSRWSSEDLRWGKFIRKHPDPLYTKLLGQQYTDVKQAYDQMSEQGLSGHDDALGLREDMNRILSEQQRIG
jgi:tRNA (adenine22-N1)-methyltransferase